MNNSSNSTNNSKKNENVIGASEARNNFSDLLSKVEYGGQEILIERYGEVVAKLMPVEKQVRQVRKVQRVEKSEPEKPPTRQYSRRIPTQPREAGLSGHYQAIAKQLEELSELRLKRAEKAEQKSEKEDRSHQSEADKRAEVIRKKIKLVLE